MIDDEYHWYKQHGICPKCRVNNAFYNRVFCAECLEKQINANIKYKTPEKRKQYNQTQRLHKKAQREERKASGLCTRCGKRKAQKGLLCVECWAHRQVYRQREKIGKLRRGQHFNERKARGVCLYCQGDVVPGKCFCEIHLKGIQESLERNREKMSKTWRKEIAGCWEEAKTIHQKKERQKNEKNM